MNIFIKSIMVLSAALLVSGCSEVATFDYDNVPEPPMARFEEPVAKTVAVVPFLDERDARYHDPLLAKLAAAHPTEESGSLYLGFIPLLPGGYVEREKPEKNEDYVSLGGFDFNLQKDLANAAFKSLKASNLFSSVTKASSMEDAEDADYIWRGKVLNTCYSGNVYSYCVTYLVSPVLWVLGAPYGSSKNELYVRFELIERATGKVVWKEDYQGSDYVVQWIYGRLGKDTSLYPKLMRAAMNHSLGLLSYRLPVLLR